MFKGDRNMDKRKEKKKKKDVSKYIELDPTLESSEKPYYLQSDGSWATVDARLMEQGLTLSELKIIGLDHLIEEELNEREPLNIQQRRARGRAMRRHKNKMKLARKRAARKKASPEKLKIRARKKARAVIRDRLSAGKKYSEMTPSEKIQLDRRVNRIPDTVITRIATRQLPQVRKAEMDRLVRVRNAASGATKTEDLNSRFENFISENSEQGNPKKRFHKLYKKEGSVNVDKRFKIYKEKINPYFSEEFLDEAKALMIAVETKIDKNDPSNREHGTDTLVKILKKDTPGQTESYYSNQIGSTFSVFRRGDRVVFSCHSMDMIDDNELEREGTVVGSTVQHLRIRDDDGVLYLVRHSDASIIQSIDEAFSEKFTRD